MRINFLSVIKKLMSSTLIFIGIKSGVVLFLHNYLLNIFVFNVDLDGLIKVNSRNLVCFFFLELLRFVVNLNWGFVLVHCLFVVILKDEEKLLNRLFIFDILDFLHIPI